MNKNIASPCISVCLLDEDDVCVGCYRSAAEITQWMDADDETKQRILDNCHERMQAQQRQPLK